jgi:hypothetical protein
VSLQQAAAEAPAEASSAAGGLQMHTLTGTVTLVTFQNERNGYTILKLLAGEGGRAKMHTVVGELPKLLKGQRLSVCGSWLDNKQYGRQLKARGCGEAVGGWIKPCSSESLSLALQVSSYELVKQDDAEAAHSLLANGRAPP